MNRWGKVPSIVVMSFVSLSLFQNAVAKGLLDCKDTDQGINPRVAGQVIYNTLPKSCMGDEKKERTCFRAQVVDQDECKSPEILLEQYCDQNGTPVEKEIQCPCAHGVCLK